MDLIFHGENKRTETLYARHPPAPTPSQFFLPFTQNIFAMRMPKWRKKSIDLVSPPFRAQFGYENRPWVENQSLFSALSLCLSFGILQCRGRIVPHIYPMRTGRTGGGGWPPFGFLPFTKKILWRTISEMSWLFQRLVADSPMIVDYSF